MSFARLGCSPNQSRQYARNSSDVATENNSIPARRNSARESSMTTWQKTCCAAVLLKMSIPSTFAHTSSIDICFITRSLKQYVLHHFAFAGGADELLVQALVAE